MNYEKAYKAVLKTAQQWIKDGCTDKEKICLESVFPELRESEDERIRKWIVNYLHRCVFDEEEHPKALKAIEYIEKQKINTEGDFGRGYDCGYEACLNSHGAEWLEKQKEQKEIPLMGGDTDTYFDDLRMTTKPLTSREWFDEGIKYAARLQKEQKPVQSDVEREYVRTLKSLISDFLRGKEEVDREYYQQIFDWLDGRHIEQKPILEVFGFKVGDAVRLKDGDGRKHIIKSFEEVEGLHGPNFYHVDFEDKSARSGIYPGEEYPNGYYTQMEKFEEEQKPAEKHDFVAQLKEYLANTPKEQLEAEWEKLKKWNNVGPTAEEYLRSIKPAEWSEEDRLHYANVLEALEYVKGCKSDYDKIEAVKSDIAWLKLLRNRVGKEFLQPHWKPSEEQMKALLGAEGMVRQRGYREIAKVLASLYEDLKKL